MSDSKETRRKLLFNINPNCGICGAPITIRELYSSIINIDHIIPRYHGGTNKLSNLQLTHKKCNREKGHGEMRKELNNDNKELRDGQA